MKSSKHKRKIKDKKRIIINAYIPLSNEIIVLSQIKNKSEIIEKVIERNQTIIDSINNSILNIENILLKTILIEKFVKGRESKEICIDYDINKSKMHYILDRALKYTDFDVDLYEDLIGRID